jgi:transposase
MEPDEPEAKVERLALAVAQGYSMRQAAKAADVAPTTARRWASEPSFKLRVEAIRSEVITRAVGKLARLASKAANTLGELLDKSHCGELRLKAARAILQDLLAVREHAELNERLGSIEEKMAANGKRFP